jgi:hypothetical protein
MSERCRKDVESKASNNIIAGNKDSTTKFDTSQGKVDTSQGKVDSFPEKADSVKSNKGLPRRVLYREINMICEAEYKMLEEVSLILGKSADYLKNKVFPEMIKKGLLVRLYPNIHHPHQAYKSSGKELHESE